MSDTSIIKILTYKLPFEIANQIYNEFQSRYKDSIFLIDKYKTYKPLQDNIKTVELFLSLSVFHRRIISNFDGAVKFYETITRKSKSDTISIGNYNLTFEEKNKINAVIINYHKLLEKFSIHPNVMEYNETRDFLKQLIILKSQMEKENNFKKKTGKKDRKYKDDDIPF